MLKLKWENDGRRAAMLSLPFPLTRTSKSKITNVKNWGLRGTTLQKITKSLNIEMPFGISSNEWANHITVDDIYDYLERGCRYMSSDWEAFSEMIIIGSELGWIPDICIGTELNDPRFTPFGVCYVEDLNGLIYVWEKHNKHPELIAIAKEILSNNI